MKFAIVTLSFLLLSITAHAQMEAYLGKWHAPENDNSMVLMEIDEKGKLRAKILSSDKSELVGHILIVGGEYKAKDDHVKATIHRANSSMTVGATITLESKERMKIVGKKFLMEKVFMWNRMVE